MFEVTPTDIGFKIKYELDKLAHPVLRAGMHGLYRAITKGASNPSFYPLLEEVKGCREYHTDHDNVIEIDVSDPAYLTQMLNGFLGRMDQYQAADGPCGFAVPPGYPTRDNMSNIPATMMAHEGTTRFFWASSNTANMFVLLDQKKSKAQKINYPSIQLPFGKKGSSIYFGSPVRWNVDPSTTTAGGCDPFPKGHPDHRPVVELLGPKDTVSDIIHKAQKGKSRGIKLPQSANPSFAGARGVYSEIPWPLAILVRFSRIGYIYAKRGFKDIVGLAPDGENLAWVSSRHDRWVMQTDPQVTGDDRMWLNGSAETVAWTIASLVDLPANKSYHVLSDVLEGPNTSTFWHTGTPPHWEDTYMYGSTLIKRVWMWGLHQLYGEKPVVSMLDFAIRNLSQGQDWFTGIAKIPARLSLVWGDDANKQFRHDFMGGTMLTPEEAEVVEALTSIHRTINFHHPYFWRNTLAQTRGQNIGHFLIRLKDLAKREDKLKYHGKHFDVATRHLVNITDARARDLCTIASLIWPLPKPSDDVADAPENDNTPTNPEDES